MIRSSAGGPAVRTRPAPSAAGVLAFAAIVLLGLNLRLLFGSTSAVLGDIRQAYRLDAGSAALLTTGPVVCLGVFAVVAPRAVRRWSVPVVLTWCSVLIAVGTALRGIPTWPVLVLGTLLAGMAIAAANVLGPILIRLFFPQRIGLLTGVFTALVSASAGIASGVTIPLDTYVFHSWRTTLMAWALPSLFAVAAMAQLASRLRRGRYRVHNPTVRSPTRSPTRWQAGVLRSPVAWAVTGFMGLQSLLAYSMIAWLPTIYRDRGVSAESAGLVLTALSIASIATALSTPMVATRVRNQSVLAVGVVALSVVGLIGVLVGSVGAAVVWAILLGLGQGGQLSLALTLINLRAENAAVATSLSTMAQSVGYLVAAVGPMAAGVIHGSTDSWTVPLGVLLLVMIPLSVFGWMAGRAVPVAVAQ